MNFLNHIAQATETIDHHFYIKVTNVTSPAAAFNDLIDHFRQHGTTIERSFKIHLRSGNHTNMAPIDYAYFQMQAAAACEPIGCIFDHDGWIFFGII